MDTPVQGSDLAGRRRRRLVRHAISYVEARPAHRVTISELCDALSVGRRTLEYAFRDVLDASPSAYFIRRALEATHLVLKASSPADRTVSQVATDFGFWHLGRFSARYQTEYGVRPSQTLREVPEGSPAARALCG